MAFGRFERGAQQVPMSEINVTPLVDVMMVLLVIFIITTPLMVRALKLDLPKAAPAPTGVAQRVIAVAINAQGEIFLDQEAIDMDALARAFQTRARQAAQSGADEWPEVQMQADVKVPYGQVVEVMGLAQQAGLSRIGFVTERKP